MMSSKFDLLKPQAKRESFAEERINERTTTFKQDNLIYISLEDLIPFDRQPFKPYTDEQLEELALSIKENGVISPILVRPIKNRYQIVAGHNRVIAVRMLGQDKIKAVINELSDEQADIMLVESNLKTRTTFAHSEKAFAYKLQYEARKKQGERSDLTSSHYGTKLRTDEYMSNVSDDSRNQVQRYVKIAELITPFLDLLDSGKLPFLAAYNLAFLSNPVQEMVCEYFNATSIDVPLAEQLKLIGNDLTEEYLIKLTKNTTEEKTFKSVKISFKNIKTYFTKNESKKEIENIIVKALDEYFNKEEAQLGNK